MYTWQKIRHVIFKPHEFTGLYKTPLNAIGMSGFENKRQMATWDGAIRSTNPKAPKYEPNGKYWDRETGLEIMKYVDFSGANHSLLRDSDFKHPMYSKIYGVFTSSEKPINGNHPEMIDNHFFTGKTSPQFIFPFFKPKLILTVYLKDDNVVNLSAAHIQEYLATLEKKNLNDG